MRATDVLRSGMLVQGEQVQRFEEMLASYIGVKHVVAVSSGTAALHVVLEALGVGMGDAVLVPAFSFVATANAVRLAGATPVFIDVSQDDYNMDVGLLGKAVAEYSGEEKLKAIMPVHEFGCPAKMDSICQVAEERGLLVIEDAACALGAKYNGQHVGTFGECGCFSFHPRKSITTGEGGAISTDDDDLMERLRLLRNHGLVRDGGRIDCEFAGYNYRMTDFQAALGINQLVRFDEGLAQRRVLVGRYYESLADHRALALPAKSEGHAWQSLMLVLEQGRLPELIEVAYAEGIQFGAGAQCIPYTKAYGKSEDFCTARRCEQQGFVVPLYAGLSPEAVDSVVALLEDCQ